MDREFKIKGLIMDPLTNSPIVILQSVEKNTLLPIWVGIFEANAIALQIERIDTPRPLTHDLIKNILLQLDANVDKIVVTDLQGNTFYAVIHLRMNGDHITLTVAPAMPSPWPCGPTRPSLSLKRSSTTAETSVWKKRIWIQRTLRSGWRTSTPTTWANIRCERPLRGRRAGVTS